MKLLNLLLSARNRKIRPRSPLIIIFILSALILAVTSPALALSLHLPGPAVEWTSSPDYIDLDRNWTYGFSFRINTDLWVTHLGVYDSGLDGLEISHDVGLWNLDSTIITAASVAAGTSADLDGHFRYTAIDPFLLARGSYMIGAYWQKNEDPYAVNPAGFITNQHVLYLDDAYIQDENGDGLMFPSDSYDPPTGPDLKGWFGANLKLSLTEPKPVPEPQTMLLLGVGLIGLAGFGRKRIKKN